MSTTTSNREVLRGPLGWKVPNLDRFDSSRINHLTVADALVFFRRLAAMNQWLRVNLDEFPARPYNYRHKRQNGAGDIVTVRGGWLRYSNAEMVGSQGAQRLGLERLEPGMNYGGKEVHSLTSLSGGDSAAETTILAVTRQPVVVRGILPSPGHVMDYHFNVQAGNNQVDSTTPPIEQDDIVNEGIHNAIAVLTA